MKLQVTMVKTSLIILLAVFSSADISYGTETVVENRYGVDTNSPSYAEAPILADSINPFTKAGYHDECTAFAWGRAYDRLGWDVSPRGNACSWWTTTYAHYAQHPANEPRANSFAIWWNPENSCDVSGPITGHVAYVEEVDGDYVYINEANIGSAGYNGFTKRLTKSDMLQRGSLILKGYLYLDSPFSDYWYWDFDNQGTEDWNAMNVYNQGIFHPNSTDAYWQLGSSFSPHKRSIVSPVLNTINTSEFNAIEITFGENEHQHDGVTALCPTVVYAWFMMNLDGVMKWHGPVTIPWVEGRGTPGSQNTYRGSIPYSGQIQRVRFDFDKDSPVEDAKIYIAKISFVYADAEQDFYILSGTITDPNGSYWYVTARETSGANLGNNTSVSTKYFEMALFPGNYDVSCSSTININGGGSISLSSPVQNVNVTQNTPIDIVIPSNYQIVHITGYVTDEQGLGIQNMNIYANDYKSCSSSSYSDQNGFFDLSVIPGTYYIQFYPPAGSIYTSTYINNVVIADDTDLGNIVFNSLIRYLITGNFVDASGIKAFAGFSYAYVYAYNYDNQDYQYSNTDDGYFEFNLSVGNYSIYAYLYNSYTNGYTSTNSTYQTITIPDTDILSILLPSYDYYIMEGTVTDTNGIAQPNVSIRANESNGRCNGYGYSDANGHYSLKLIPGQYSMTVTSPPATYPPFQINNVIIKGDCQRNIRLSRDYSILDAAISQLNPGLDVALDVFDIINQADTLNYNITVESAKKLLEIILNWAGSEMSVTVYDPAGNLYGTFRSTQPPVKVDIPNPAAGTWRCEVTAIDVPYDNYPFAFVAGVTANQAPFAAAGGPYSGYVGSAKTFDASGSYDSDGDVVLYEWDWNNDGVYEQSSTSATISHTWALAYNGTIRLRVTDNGGLSATNTTTVNITAQIPNYTLSAAVTGGHGTVSPTSGTYTQGTVVSLAATPDSSYRVKAWHGTNNDTSKATANTVTMSTIRTVTVEFEAITVTTYTLSASVTGGHGTVSPTSGTYTQGKGVSLTATPDSNYRVKAWHGTNNDTSKATTNSVTMNTIRTVTVEFEAIPAPTYTLSAAVTGGHGTVSPTSGTYTQGTSVSLTATPDSNYRVKAWHGTNDDTSKATTNSVTMNTSRTVTVEFEAITVATYTLSASVTGGHGTVSPVSGTYNQGTVVSLTATPDSNYRVKGWHGTNSDASTATTNSVTMNTNCTVTVEFEMISGQTYTLHASVLNGHGAITISPLSSGPYLQGTVVNLSATPEEGYIVKAWAGTDNDTSTANSNTVTMNADSTVTVEFTGSVNAEEKKGGGGGGGGCFISTSVSDCTTSHSLTFLVFACMIFGGLYRKYFCN